MSIVSHLIDAFRPFSHEREAQKKLTEARLLLVEHECQHEYYASSVSMLKARIHRLESAATPPGERNNSPTTILGRSAGQPKTGLVGIGGGAAVPAAQWAEKNGMHHIAASTNTHVGVTG